MKFKILVKLRKRFIKMGMEKNGKDRKENNEIIEGRWENGGGRSWKEGRNLKEEMMEEN